MVIVSMTLAFLFMLIRKLITKLRILYRCYKFSKTIKGPNTAELKVNKTSDRLLKWLKSCRQQYGKIFCVWSGTEFAVVITDREDVEMVISNEDIPKKSSIFKKVPNWIGQGLSHDDWGKVRKLSTTEFSFSQIVENNCQTLISNIEDHGYKSPFDIAPIFSKYSLNICCEIALGVKKNSDFVGILRNHFESSEVQGSFMTHEGRKIKAAIKFIHKHTMDIIKAKKGNVTNIDSFIDFLLHAQKNGISLITKNIRDEVHRFILEGQSTMTTILSFAVHLLSMHPEAQQRAYEEITNCEGSKKPYLEAVVKETVRLFPPVPIVSRLLSQDLLIRNMLIPKGAHLEMLSYIANRDFNEFQDPCRFLPERFMSIDSADPIGYSDFKGGLKIWNRQFELRALTSILRNFEVLPVDNFEPEIVFDGTIKSRHGIQVCLKKRVI
ncbi:hypothetical protein ACFFRR_006178 [Megaselia abdita]